MCACVREYIPVPLMARGKLCVSGLGVHTLQCFILLVLFPAGCALSFGKQEARRAEPGCSEGTTVERDPEVWALVRFP